MSDDDLDALAAEYVLGTLASDERSRAEGLISSDQTFAELVRQWERRLGELNVMVEAVEPPPQVWDRIKSGLGPSLASTAPIDDLKLPPLNPLAPDLAAMPEAPAAAELLTPHHDEDPEPIGAPAASLLPPDVPAEGEPEAKPEEQPEPAASVAPAPPAAPRQAVPTADVIVLAQRVKRWRGLAVVAGALAAGFAALIVVSQADPGLFPPGGFHIPQLVAQGTAPAKPAPQGARLVAVLQQEPSSPAFLLTIDPASRTLTVRRVTAKEQPDHSYQLWLIAAHATKPESLGVVGSGEYTQNPLPADVDTAALRTATYAVSFEPAGGSKTGAPTGPVLFTGKLVEAVPPPGSSPKT